MIFATETAEDGGNERNQENRKAGKRNPGKFVAEFQGTTAWAAVRLRRDGWEAVIPCCTLACFTKGFYNDWSPALAACRWVGVPTRRGSP